MPTYFLLALAHAAEPTSSDDSFGAELERLQVKVNWSAYGDILLQGDSDGNLSFDDWHVNPILRAALGTNLVTEIELEFEHGGQDVLLEYAYTEWRPSPAFHTRVGKLLVPVGRYNTDLHPSFRWTQATRPDFVSIVLPAVWSEAGAQAGLTLRPQPALALRLLLHAGNGLAGTLDPAAPEGVRDLRPEGLDNNLDKGVGGRATVEVIPLFGHVQLDLSGYTSAIDDAGATRWSIADAALSLTAGPVDLAAEGAVTWLDTDLLSWGGYALLAVDLADFTPALRLDYDGTPQRAQEVGVAGSLLYKPIPWWSMRAEAEVTIVPTPYVLGTLMGSFFF